MKIGFKYRFIQELEKPSSAYVSDDLTNLAHIRQEQRGRLRSSSALQKFNTELSREWAVETGIIENLYTLDRGTAQILIEQGFKASLIPRGSSNREPEDVVSMINDHKTTLESLFQFVNQTRGLSASYIKALHQRITRSQKTVQARDSFGRLGEVPLERGTWKTQPNDPKRPDGLLHEYCPPVHVDAEMDRLIAMYNDYKNQQTEPEVLAAWLHHRFTQIHPFQDGNGRIARVLASLVFIQCGWFPLLVTRDMRPDYITALEKADHGELDDLVLLFSKNQKASFLKSLSLSEQVLRKETRVSSIIDSALEKIRERKISSQSQRKGVFDFGDNAANFIYEKLCRLSEDMSRKLSDTEAGYSFFAEKSGSENHSWFYRQIVETAEKLGYFADMKTYSQWVRLQIRELGERRTDIIFPIHALGRPFSGVLAVSSLIQFRVQSEDSRSMDWEIHTLSDDVFQMSYRSDYANVEKRLSDWYEGAVILGLEEWHRQI